MIVPAAQAFAKLQELKEAGFNVLVDLTAIDYSAYEKPSKEVGSFRMYNLSDDPKAPAKAPDHGKRFEVVYRLLSLDVESGMEKAREEVRCALDEGEPVPRSAAPIWPAADWLEREVWDMFGIPFADRPDIKRILLYDSFVGHPLRKDYRISKRQPLIGPPSGEAEGAPTFSVTKPTMRGE
jgi:NADH-quinone oxidoreductase subunit C